MHQQQSDFLILVLYDFIVQSIPVDNCCIIINTLINLHDPIYL
jgi:hypothetical protein